MKGIFTLEQKELPVEFFQILPDVTEDKEKKAQVEKWMNPTDVSHIKIPTNIQDERFDQLIYREPYFTQHGNTFEFERIAEWLEKNNTDPADNEVLENKTLVPNKGFLSRVNQFLEKNSQVLDSAELYLPRRWVSELELACESGDLDKIKRLYDLDKRLFSWTFDFSEEKYAHYQGKNILHITCALGKPEAILKLLEYIEKRAEGLALLMLLQRDKHGKLPIQYAMQAGDNPQLMRMLAAKMGNHLLVVEPVALPSTNNQENRFQTTLHITVTNNDAKLIKFLVEHKADIHIKDGAGNTALHLALGLGLKESIEMLIKLGASEVIVNDNGLTPEKLGIAHKQNESVQTLAQALEQRTKTQQDHLKDLGPLSQMIFNMKFSLEQFAIKSQKQDDEINCLREMIGNLYCEIGYLRLTGHALNREFVYSRKRNSSSGGLIGLFGLPLMLSPDVKQTQTQWTPKSFGEQPITKIQARKMILEDLPPQTQKVMFFVEEKGCSKDYTFTSLKYEDHQLACWSMLPNGNVIASYFKLDAHGYKSSDRFFIRIWNPKGDVIKEVKTEYKINALHAISNDGFISSFDEGIEIWNAKGECISTWKNEEIRGFNHFAVLPDGKIIGAFAARRWDQKSTDSIKIWDQKGECINKITVNTEYKHIIVDSTPPQNVQSQTLYITVDSKNQKFSIESTHIKPPFRFSLKEYELDYLSENTIPESGKIYIKDKGDSVEYLVFRNRSEYEPDHRSGSFVKKNLKEDEAKDKASRGPWGSPLPPLTAEIKEEIPKSLHAKNIDQWKPFLPRIIEILVRQGDIEDRYVRFNKLLEPFKSDGFPLDLTEEKLSQDVEKSKREYRGLWNELLKLAYPYTQARIIPETLIVWNGQIIAGMSDGTISRWESNGTFLGRFSKPVAAAVSVLAVHKGSLISATGRQVQFWNNELKCTTSYSYHSSISRSISNVQTYPDDSLVVSGDEQTTFWDRNVNLFHQLKTGKKVTVLSDKQGFLYESENSIYFKFVGTPMILNIAFQKELLLANAKLHKSNATLMVRTMSPCSEGLIALGAILQNLCGEIPLQIEFTDTEMRILNIPTTDSMADLENLCQLFGAAKFVPIPRPIINPVAQSRLEETKTHRVTHVPVLPLTSPSGLIAGTKKPAQKDYFNALTQENDEVKLRG